MPVNGGWYERGLSRGCRGVFRSLLWHVPFTMHPTLFSHPLRVNGMAGVSLAPMPPGIALKTAAARYAPLRLHLAEASLTGR